MAPTIPEILKEGVRRLAGVDSPRLSAEVLVAEVLGLSRVQMVIDRNRRLTDAELERIEELFLRREQGEPVAYLLGRKEFYGLDFIVSPDVLIPRPETEQIVEEVESSFDAEDTLRFVDYGTGSGILAVTIATLFPRFQCIAVDKSPSALEIAVKNSKIHGVSDRIQFVLGDFTLPLLKTRGVDFMVSNPPYVTDSEYENASSEVTGFEPKTALVSGESGLDHFRAMLPLVYDALKSGGQFWGEFGAGQGDSLQIITRDEPMDFRDVKVLRDLAGHDRVLFLQKR